MFGTITASGPHGFSRGGEGGGQILADDVPMNRGSERPGPFEVGTTGPIHGASEPKDLRIRGVQNRGGRQVSRAIQIGIDRRTTPGIDFDSEDAGFVPSLNPLPTDRGKLDRGSISGPHPIDRDTAPIQPS